MTTSNDKPRRDPKQSTPGMLRARMREAHAAGKPMDLDYEEVTGVIEVVNAIGKETVEKGRAAVDALIRRLDSDMPPPKAEPT